MPLEDYRESEYLEYEFDKRFRRETFDRTRIQDEFREPEIKTIEIVKKRAMPRMEDTKIQPIKRETPEIFGNLFDRVDFLKSRMQENEDLMKEREALHNGFIKEITEDIADKEEMATHITDIDERRNFKLDISILRKERRHESIQFWKDILELKTEFRELTEKLQTEEKILSAFKKIEGGVND